MKVKMLIAGLSFMAIASLALAGYVQPAPVTISINPDGSGTATGDMVTARFSDNDVEHIGCGVRLYKFADGTSFNYGFCQAEDADGVDAFCSTEDEELLDIMKATADYSFITFGWNADEECTNIGFSTQSFYIPEHTSNRGKGNN